MVAPLLLALLAASAPASASPQRASASCARICDSSDFASYEPQLCDERCPGRQHGPSPAPRTGRDDLAAMEQRLTAMQGRLDGLLVAVVVLGVAVASLMPLLCCREAVATRLAALCAPPKKGAVQGAAQGVAQGTWGRKRRWGGSRGSRRQNNNSIACVSRAAADPPPGYARSPAAAPSPPRAPRTRHPSETSCTAEAGAAYYNYGRSSSTLAVSPPHSRASTPRSPAPVPAPLDPAALLASGAVQPSPAPHSLPSGVHMSGRSLNTTAGRAPPAGGGSPRGRLPPGTSAPGRLPADSSPPSSASPPGDSPRRESSHSGDVTISGETVTTTCETLNSRF